MLGRYRSANLTGIPRGYLWPCSRFSAASPQDNELRRDQAARVEFLALLDRGTAQRQTGRFGCLGRLALNDQTQRSAASPPSGRAQAHFVRLQSRRRGIANSRSDRTTLPLGILSCSAFQPTRTIKSALPPLAARNASEPARGHNCDRQCGFRPPAGRRVQALRRHAGRSVQDARTRRCQDRTRRGRASRCLCCRVC